MSYSAHDQAARARWAVNALLWTITSSTVPPSQPAGHRYARLVEDVASKTIRGAWTDWLDTVQAYLQPQHFFPAKCVHVADEFHIDFDGWLSKVVGGISTSETGDADRRARTVAMLDSWLNEAPSKEAAADLAELKSALDKNRKGQRRLFPE